MKLERIAAVHANTQTNDAASGKTKEERSNLAQSIQYDQYAL